MTIDDRAHIAATKGGRALGVHQGAFFQFAEEFSQQHPHDDPAGDHQPRPVRLYLTASQAEEFELLAHALGVTVGALATHGVLELLHRVQAQSGKLPRSEQRGAA